MNKVIKQCFNKPLGGQESPKVENIIILRIFIYQRMGVQSIKGSRVPRRERQFFYFKRRGDAKY